MMKRFVALLLVFILAMGTIVSYGAETNTNEYNDQNAVRIINPFNKAIISDSVLLSLKARKGAQYKVGVFYEEEEAARAVVSPQNKTDITANNMANNVLNTTKEALSMFMTKSIKLSMDSEEVANKEVILLSDVQSADSTVNFYNKELVELKEGNYLVVVEIYKDDKISSIVNKSFVVKKPEQIDIMKIQSLATKALPEKTVKQNIFKTIFRSIFGD